MRGFAARSAKVATQPGTGSRRRRWSSPDKRPVGAFGGAAYHRGMSQYVSEAIGTFFLCFAGCGAIVVNDVTGGTVGHVGVALTFGLVVMAMIYACGEVSGAHLNPAVTAGFWLAGRMRGSAVPGYVASQLVGAVAASGVLALLFPAHPDLGATLPGASAAALGRAFLVEVVITAMLVYVILAVATGAKEKGLMAGVAVGGTIGLAALFAGPARGWGHIVI